MIHPDSPSGHTPVGARPKGGLAVHRALGAALAQGSDALQFLKTGLGLLGAHHPARGYALVQQGRLLASEGLAEATGGDLSLSLRYLGRTVGELLVFSPGEGFNLAAVSELLPTLAAVVANHRPGPTLAAILERLPEGVILADPLGAVRIVNAAASKLLGLKVGKGAQVGALFLDPQEGLGALKAAQDPLGFRGERMLQGPGGEFPAHVSGRRLGGDDERILWIFYDLSAMRQGERARRRQEMLDAISSLAAGTAHELNNPLTGVMGFAQLLAEDPTDIEAPRYLSLILEQVRRCQGVVRKLLLFGQNHPLREEEVRLADVVDQALKRGGYTWRLGSVEIDARVPEELPILKGDRDLLEQAVFHVLENAFAAMPDGGALTLTARALEGPESPLKVPTLELVVADTGEGIPGQLLERVLDPFFTTREVGEGSGMGLTIAYGVVREHGGDIDLTSVPWEGTRVRILLPIAGPPGSAPPGPAYALTASGEGR